MSDLQDLRRREILRCGILLAVACLVPDAARAASVLARTDRWRQFGVRMFPHASSAEFISHRFLASRPDASRLIAAVLERVEYDSVNSHDRSDEEIVMSALNSDYEHSRIVEVDGWALSETEVAFCVLAARVHHL